MAKGALKKPLPKGARQSGENCIPSEEKRNIIS